MLKALLIAALSPLLGHEQTSRRHEEIGAIDPFQSLPDGILCDAQPPAINVLVLVPGLGESP